MIPESDYSIGQRISTFKDARIVQSSAADLYQSNDLGQNQFNESMQWYVDRIYAGIRNLDIRLALLEREYGSFACELDSKMA